MTRIIQPIIALLLIISGNLCADTFTNRATGETFNGYALQKEIGGKGRVYIENDGKYKARTVVLSEYDIKYGPEGRRNSIIVIPFKEKGGLISKVVSETFAKTIIEASNKGPLYIILELDSPGGRGDYMDIVCKAILSVRNCPVIAYITGDKFGGVYGGAAAVALACDKIYISPSASMGSLAPAFANPSDMESAFSNILSPTNLVTYSGYAAKLAAKNDRPQLIASALMDRSFEVLEVSIGQKGVRKFISAEDRTGSHNLIKRWTQVINIPSSKGTGPSGKLTLLTITGEDALYCKMADKIAISQADVIYDLNASDAKVIKSPVIASISRKFANTQRSIAKLIASIEYQEQTKEQLESRLEKLITQNGNINIRLQSNEQNTRYNDRYYNQRYSNRYNNSNRSQYNRNARNIQMAGQTIQTDQRSLARAQVTIELIEVLNGLINDYRRVIRFAKKFPGAMPVDISIYTIDNKQTTAQIKLNHLYAKSY